MNLISELRQKRFVRLKPPKLLRVSEWANQYRKLSPEAAARPGAFDINVTPFMREIADSFGDPRCSEVRVRKSSQVAYSENLNNYLGRQIHLNPGACMMIQPTLEMAESYSKDRISPMIRDTPVLFKLIDERSKTSGNTILKKSFSGGLLQMVGANSPASLASRPIRDVVIDEEDRTAKSAGKEGDPEKLAARRQTTFFDRKLIAGGTPVIKGASKTERGYLKGDQRNYLVECPCCGDHIALEFKRLQKDPEKEHYAEFQCPQCDGWIEHKHKSKMCRDKLAGGTAYWKPTETRKAKSWDSKENEWKREEAEVAYEWDAELGRYVESAPVVRSYYIWAAYSNFITWKQICDEYNEAKDDPELLQTFYNTIVGVPYEYTQNDLDFEELFKSAEKIDLNNLPSQIRVITAGVDTQNDRFEYCLIGWGASEEAWVLDYGIIDGDPESEETRKELSDFMSGQEFETEDERKLTVSGYFIDSGGHRTDAVYKFARGRHFQKIYACKGLSTAGNPVFSGFKRLVQKRVKLAHVGTDTAKHAIYAKLAKDAGEEGRVHFSKRLPLSYFEGLVSEEAITRMHKGQPIVRFEKKKGNNARNEPLDCFVYAFASLRSMKISLRKRSRRMVLEQRKAASAARTGEADEDNPPAAQEPAEEATNTEEKKAPRKGKVVKARRRRRR